MQVVGFPEKNNELMVEDVPLTDIFAALGSPAYVYSVAHIRHQYAALNGAMQRNLPADRQPMICYACKANSNVAVLRLLKNMGSSLEVGSEGELIRGLKAGFDPQKIVANGTAKTNEYIRSCLEADIYQFNVESLSELKQINEMAAGMGRVAHVVFRLNPVVENAGGNAKISTADLKSKFGMLEQYVFEAYEAAQTMKNVQAVGVSMHIGSQVTDVADFETAFKKYTKIVHDLRAKGHEVSRLDIGGGFPIQYKDEDKLLDLDAYAAWVNNYIAPLGGQIMVEPGRYLVGNAGVLITQVARVAGVFIYLDGSMTELIRPAFYDAYHAIEPVKNRDAPKKIYDVADPVCESSGMFARDREIAEVKAGDVMVIRSAGAYGFTMASNYNSRVLPAEVLVNGDRFDIIREREDIHEVVEKDKVPDYLL
jgi:diaminopimelate decarboxylase